MYTAKITSKIQDVNSRLWNVTTEFTNGVDTFVETIIPQDKAGYEYWRNSRLASLNGVTELAQENNVGVVFELPTVTPPTQAELDKTAWFAKYNELEQLEKIASKNFLTAGRLTILNNKISAVKSYLDTNAKAAYLDFI